MLSGIRLKPEPTGAAALIQLNDDPLATGPPSAGIRASFQADGRRRNVLRIRKVALSQSSRQRSVELMWHQTQYI